MSHRPSQLTSSDDHSIQFIMQSERPLLFTTYDLDVARRAGSFATAFTRPRVDKVACFQV